MTTTVSTRHIDTSDGAVSLTVSYPSDCCSCYASTLRFPSLNIEVAAGRGDEGTDDFELTFAKPELQVLVSLTYTQLLFFMDELAAAKLAYLEASSEG